MRITFPDGSVREYENGTNGLDIAASLSQGLRKAVLCCEIDGVRTDAFLPIEQDCALKFLTFEDEGGRWTYRHTASHILAQAVKRLWPELRIKPKIFFCLICCNDSLCHVCILRYRYTSMPASAHSESAYLL